MKDSSDKRFKKLSWNKILPNSTNYHLSVRLFKELEE